MTVKNLVGQTDQQPLDHRQLDHLSLLKISGEDSIEFLQGQLTNDINKLDGNWQYSGYCNPKGRLLALLQIWRSGEVIFALVNSSVVDTIAKRLRMYVLRSKVTIELIDTPTIIGLKELKSLTQAIANSATKLSQPNGVVVVSAANAPPAFALAIPNEVAHQIDTSSEARVLLIGIETNEIVQKLSDKHINDQRLSTSQWLAHDILCGLPQVSERIRELFIPQMLNLDVIGGISFKKGCYTGQEIVARMHYLGKLKQRMFVCELSQTSSELQSGDKIFADSELTKAVGNLVMICAESPSVLAVLRVDYLASGESEFGNALFVDSETELTVYAEQPYELPANAKS